MTDRLQNWGRLAVWALPVYGVLLAVGTITRQPDYQADFPAYARYITTPRFLVSHLIASVAGAGFGLVGAAALFILADRTAPRQVGWGFGLWAFAQVGLASVFGVAAFFQPAIGRAFLDRSREVAVAINEDVYGTPLFLTAGLSVLLFIAGGILLGIAAGRTRSWPRGRDSHSPHRSPCSPSVTSSAFPSSNRWPDSASPGPALDSPWRPGNQPARAWISSPLRGRRETGTRSPLGGAGGRPLLARESSRSPEGAPFGGSLS